MKSSKSDLAPKYTFGRILDSTQKPVNSLKKTAINCPRKEHKSSHPTSNFIG